MNSRRFVLRLAPVALLALALAACKPKIGTCVEEYPAGAAVPGAAAFKTCTVNSRSNGCTSVGNSVTAHFFEEGPREGMARCLAAGAVYPKRKSDPEGRGSLNFIQSTTGLEYSITEEHCTVEYSDQQ